MAKLSKKYVVVAYGNTTANSQDFNTLQECKEWAENRSEGSYNVYRSLKEVKAAWEAIYYSTGNPATLRKELASIIRYHDKNFFESND